jgi:copper chaperone CopZ
MEMSLDIKNQLHGNKDSADYQIIYNDWIRTNRNIETILEFTEESIFFIDSKLNLESQYSKNLEKVFNQKELSNKSFISLLEDRVPKSIVKDTQEYLVLMFKDELDVDIINELNPLSEIELHFEDKSGLWTSSKYFSFKFKRIFEKGKIVKLFSTVIDVSEKKSLFLKLKEVQDKTEKQLEWLADIMHIEPPLLKEFLDVTEYEINQIDNGLKNTSVIKSLKSFLNKIQRTLNQMQNNASLLRLSFFIDQIKKFESEILQLKNKGEISGSDFIPAVFQLSKLKLMIDDTKLLMQRFKHFKDVTKQTEKLDGGLIIRVIDKLVKELSKDLGRNIIFKYNKFNSTDIPVSHQKIVREFLVILTRFSIYYGIEEPQERKEANKNPIGTLEIESFVEKRIFGFKLKHDGRLVKIERLLQKTVESADAIVLEDDKVPEKEQLGSEVIKFLFMPSMATSNFSEAEYSKEIFRDMELVKKKLKMHGGKIKITFSSEQHCEYTISFFNI